MIMLWKLYTWLFNLIYIVMEFMPMCIRRLIFKLMLKDFGSHSYVDYKSYIRYPHKISIGKNVAVNRGCKFLASAHSNEKVDILIGDNSVFAPGVELLSAGHDYHYIDLPDTYGKITIGNNVWIGANSIILQGVSVGEGAVVGAGSIVAKDIPPYTVWVGNPARKIKDRDLFS